MHYLEKDRLSTEYANRFRKKPPTPAGMCGYIGGIVVFSIIAVFKEIANLPEEFGFISQSALSIIAGTATWLYFRSIERQWREHYNREFRRLDSLVDKISN